MGALLSGSLLVISQKLDKPPGHLEKKQGFALFFSDPKRQPVWQEGQYFTWPSGDCVQVQDRRGNATFQTCGVLAVRKMQEPEEPKK